MPLVEAGETEGAGADWFLHRYLDPVLAAPRPPQRLLLGCTHYPILLPGIRRIVPASIEVLTQGGIVATRLADWLARHPEHETRLARGGAQRIATTDDPAWFAGVSSRFLGETLDVGRARLSPVA